MAAKSKILFDKTEVIMLETEGKPQIHNLTYDKIISIQFDKANAKKLFKAIPTEKISVMVRGKEKPIIYFLHKEGDFFADYKTGLEKFAHDNRITFHNNL